jgi:hypothetical protein
VPSIPSSTNSRWLIKQGPVLSIPGLTDSRWLIKQGLVLSIPSLIEAGALGSLSVLVPVLKARLLGLRAVLARTRYYREMPYRFP